MEDLKRGRGSACALDIPVEYVKFGKPNFDSWSEPQSYNYIAPFVKCCLAETVGDPISV